MQSGSADFCTILVYDVSRWGWLQDADDSSYYEFLCKMTVVDTSCIVPSNSSLIAPEAREAHCSAALI